MQHYQLLAIICAFGACAGACLFGPQCAKPCPSGCQHHLPESRSPGTTPNYASHPTIAYPFAPAEEPQAVPVIDSTTREPGSLGRFLQTKPPYPPTTADPPIPANPTSVVSLCHPDTGACLSGCVKGRHGSMCQNACSSNCLDLDCLQTGECVSGCRRGWYGDLCTKPCSSNCIYQECHQNGTCANGCIAGFYGPSCDEPCGKNCLRHSCRQNSSTGTFVCAGGCVDGWRGRMCQQRCPVHCLSCHPDIERGSCSSCQQGWGGINCRIPIINHCKAPVKGERCTSGCSDGFRGVTCQMKCPDFCLRCEQDGNECTLCHPGRFGSRCDKFCKDCQQGLCQIDTGECIHGSWQQEDEVCYQNEYMLGFNSTHCAKHHREKRHIVECFVHCQSSSCSSCDLGWFGERCTKFCPQNCYDGCNKTGACNGCQPNYYGVKCELKCPRNCRESSPGEVICDEKGQCLSGCKIGRHGDYCNMTCPRNCKGNLCNQYNGKCTDGCRLGWKWNRHLNRCLQEPFTLLRNIKPKHQPLSCRNQMYGDSCEINCSTTCINASCEFSSERKSPVCSIGCVEGYHGEYCQNRCPASCQSCSSKSVCTSCKPGLYGETCSETCSSNCKGCWCLKNGNCAKGCIEGYHGQACEARCEANCQSCDQMSGRCLSCKPGWCGVNCDQVCGGCKLGMCGEDGQCQLGCNPGYAGPMCNESLFENEQPCFKVKNVPKRRKRHTCQYGCMTSECAVCLDGFYSDMCHKKCPDNCEGTCNKTTGQCDHSCKNGTYWGPHCEDKCPMNCLDGCDMSSGQCYGGCKNGWHGLRCDEKCPEKCKEDVCFHDSGKCLQGCVDGWQGDLCNVPCSEGCYNESCFQNGTCKLGCYSNDTGSSRKCSMPCMENCAGNICNISKSLRVYVCTQGCKDGFTGASCNEKCSGSCETCEQFNPLRCKVCPCGMYGSECQYHCSKTSNNSTCPVCDNKGACLHGCVNGTWGQQCQENCSSNCIACDGGAEECTQCKKGFYGKTCSEKCSGCEDEDCHQDGKCIKGCVHGLKGPKCDIVSSVSEWTAGHFVFVIAVLCGTLIYFGFLCYFQAFKG